MRAPSLQRRLLWLVGLPVVALWLAAGLWLAQRTAHETAEMFDRELERTAASVLAILSTVPDARLAAARLEAAGDDEGERAEIVVRDRNGRLLLDASSLPPMPAGREAPHFHMVEHAGLPGSAGGWMPSHRVTFMIVRLRNQPKLSTGMPVSRVGR